MLHSYPLVNIMLLEMSNSETTCTINTSTSCTRNIFPITMKSSTSTKVKAFYGQSEIAQQSWGNNYGEILAVLELYRLQNYLHNQSSTKAYLLIRIGCIPYNAFTISYL